MTNFTIKSRDHGKVEFFVPDNGGYVRIDRGNKPGTLGTQICHGGGFRGNTVCASADDLEKVARSWWRAHLAMHRNA